jgi:hypothetical protein
VDSLKRYEKMRYPDRLASFMDLEEVSCEHVSKQFSFAHEQTPDHQVQGQSADGQLRKNCVLGLTSGQ